MANYFLINIKGSKERSFADMIEQAVSDTDKES